MFDSEWLKFVGILVGMTLALIWGTAALSQHSHEGLVGQFYATWYRPAGIGIPHRQQSCCNEQDCYTTTFKKVGVQWLFWDRETQAWRHVPEGILEHNQPDPRESPDGSSHVCASPNHVFCAVIGSGQ